MFKVFLKFGLLLMTLANTVDACMYVLYPLVHISHYSCSMFGLCVLFRHTRAHLMAVQQLEIGVACKTTLHLPPSLPACHPESHHLFNSEVHGV